jgi:hypothetical protein
MGFFCGCIPWPRLREKGEGNGQCPTSDLSYKPFLYALVKITSHNPIIPKSWLELMPAVKLTGVFIVAYDIYSNIYLLNGKCLTGWRSDGLPATNAIR